MRQIILCNKKYLISVLPLLVWGTFLIIKAAASWFMAFTKKFYQTKL